MLLILAALVGSIAFYGWLAWPGLVAKQANSKRILKWLLLLLSCGALCFLALMLLFQLVQSPYDSIWGREPNTPSAAQYP